MKESCIKNDLLTVPNFLSVIRIILIWPFVVSVVRNEYVWSGIILAVSGLSDLFDGITARKFNQVTRLGKMLDPAADKLTLMAVMICVGMKFPKIYPFMILLISKEVIMLMASVFLLGRKKTPTSAKWFGKAATVVFYISVLVIIGLKAMFGIDNETVDITLMVITAGFMLYAMWRYFKIFVSMIKSDRIAE